DADCEKGAWSLADTTRLLKAAADRGHPVRVHADQFNALGMLEAAIDLGARSVDHLEASTPEGLVALARSDTFGVMLPACGFHLDGRYAKGRAFLDAGGKLALATNLNPGSAPCFSMPMVIALAVRHLGLSVAEAIGATTANAASLLGLTDRGHLAPGARADVIMLAHEDERALGAEIGGNPVELVIVNGQIIE
ncbi:MAG: amidohydrolase family protein, partial [Phycisphaerales bacterium]|nr:amidohydrolase family protein [Phycisphaerales bacterium]